MNLSNEIQQRLKDGGWKLQRGKSRHPVWVAPNGEQYTLHVSVKNVGRKRLNYLKQIERLERGGRNPDAHIDISNTGAIHLKLGPNYFVQWEEQL